MSPSVMVSSFALLLFSCLLLAWFRRRALRRFRAPGRIWWVIPFLPALSLCTFWKVHGGLPEGIAAFWPVLVTVVVLAAPLGMAVLGTMNLGKARGWGLAILALALTALAHWELLRPLSDRLRSHAISQDVVLQQHVASSGPAALASVLMAAGCPMTEAVVAGTMEATLFGVGLDEIAEAARAFGCSEVQTVEDGRDSLPEGWAIVAFRGDSFWRSHWVALLGRRGQTWVVADPAMGRRLLGRAELESLWDGRAVFLRPPGK